MKVFLCLVVLCFSIVDSPSSGYRDGNGKIFGYVDNDIVRDGNRKIVGYIQNGKTLDRNRRIICSNGELPGLLLQR